jgi:transposase
VTAWIMTRPDRLADAGKASLDAILAASPELAAVTAAVRDFAVIMNERRGQKLLEPWMTAAHAAGEPARRSFVTGLRADQDAVTRGLSLRWSSGAVEGHVNRIKCSNARCTAVPAPTCSAAASSSLINPHKRSRKLCQSQFSRAADNDACDAA